MLREPLPILPPSTVSQRNTNTQEIWFWIHSIWWKLACFHFLFLHSIWQQMPDTMRPEWMFEERVKAVIFKVAMFWLHTRKNKLEKWLKKKQISTPNGAKVLQSRNNTSCGKGAWDTEHLSDTTVQELLWNNTAHFRDSIISTMMGQYLISAWVC